MKRLISLLLVAVMMFSTVSVLSGCGKEEQSSDPTTEQTPIYSASIDGSFATGQSNPNLTITLSNTTASDSLTADMFTLDGAFQHLTVTNVSGSGANIHLTTEGTVVPNSSCSGIVKLAGSASASATELRAEAPVEIRTAYIDENSYEFGSSTVTFDVVLASDTFKDAAPGITVADHTVAVSSVSEDKTTATVIVTMSGTTLDEMVANLGGKELTVAGASVSSGNACTMSIALAPAAVTAYVDYISSEGSSHTAEVYLYIQNGTADLSASDLALYGDFVGAAVSSLEKVTEGEYKAVLTFTATLAEEYELNGELAVAAGKLTNAWGTTNANAAYCDLYYNNAVDRGETLDSILKFIDDHKDTLDKLSTAGSAISGVASAFSGVQTILQVVGVLESTDDKLDKINNSLKDIQSSIRALDTKIDKLSANISLQLVSVDEKQYQNLAATSQSNWNTFTDNHVLALENVLDEYTLEYNKALLNFVYNANTYSLTIYKNANGITLPSPHSNDKNIDIEGIRITETETVELGIELTLVEEKIAANKGRVYAEIMDDIEAAYCNIYDPEYLDEVMGALSMELSYKAIQEVGALKICNAFINFCNATCGSTNGIAPSPASTSAVDSYVTLISCFYNFYSEAATDIDNMMSYLASLLLRGKSLATMAYAYEPGLEKDLSTPFEWALEEIKDGGKAYDDLYVDEGYQAWLKGDKSNYYRNDSSKQYCYVADSYIGSHSGSTRIVVASARTSDCLTSREIKLMYNRWNRLNKSGITLYSSFEEYLGYYLNDGVTLQSKVFFDDRKHEWDGQYEVKCAVVRSGDYFSVGSTYTTCRSSGDVSAENWTYACRETANVLDLSTGNTYTELYVNADYYEDHWYWRNMEDATFYWYPIEDRDGITYMTQIYKN